jgi:hypothetical protein
VKQLEKMMVNGNLTIVFVKAKWCGACHRFNDEVWSPLTKLKNRSMNLAAVDSEMIGQTSLANVPRKYYPTLLLVGKDKKPATFIDEDGSPTNAMPRNDSLDDDREALSNLVQTPKNKLNTLSPTTPILTANMPVSASSPLNAKSAANFVNARSAPVNLMNATSSPENSMNASSPMNSVNSMEPTPYSMEQVSMKPSRNTVGKSPFENKNVSIPSIANEPVSDQMNEPINGQVNTASTTAATIAATLPPTPVSSLLSIPTTSAVPPDVGSDLVATQTNSSTGTAGVLKAARIGGGRLLKAIRNKTASLKAMLQLRKHHTRRNRH